MATLLHRLGKTAYRRWPFFIAAWLVAFVAVGIFAGTMSKPMTDAFSIPGIPSEKAADLQAELFPGAVDAFDQASVKVVVAAPEGHTLSEPAYAAQVQDLIADLEGLPQMPETPLADPVTAASAASAARAAGVAVCAGALVGMRAARPRPSPPRLVTGPPRSGPGSADAAQGSCSGRLCSRRLRSARLRAGSCRVFPSPAAGHVHRPRRTRRGTDGGSRTGGARAAGRGAGRGERPGEHGGTRTGWDEQSSPGVLTEMVSKRSRFVAPRPRGRARPPQAGRGPAGPRRPFRTPRIPAGRRVTRPPRRP